MGSACPPACRHSWSEPVFVARAPGRLDVMGGIADYSGSLVLQLPIREACHAVVQLQAEAGAREEGDQQNAKKGGRRAGGRVLGGCAVGDSHHVLMPGWGMAADIRAEGGGSAGKWHLAMAAPLTLMCKYN